MKTICTALLLFVSTVTFSQSNDEYWTKWNNGYPKEDVAAMLKSEKFYADSIEKHPEISPNYIRKGKYRFLAEYMGKTRPIDTNVLSSMYRVFKVTIGNTKPLGNLCKAEALFKVDTETLWMPVQVNILQALNKEVAKGDKITLYCLYLNEHASHNVLYNTFLISEFSK